MDDISGIENHIDEMMAVRRDHEMKKGKDPSKVKIARLTNVMPFERELERAKREAERAEAGKITTEETQSTGAETRRATRDKISQG